MLRCSICTGLYRFAHTVVECGHTFCQICIFTHLRSFKGRNPEFRCPECHNRIDPNFKRSIMKDIYKQSLVDLTAPKFHQEETLIAKRVQDLFPELQLETVINQFKYSTCKSCTHLVDTPKKTARKTNQQKNQLVKLPQKIKQTLGISFDKFAQMIQTEQHFAQFKKIIDSKQKQKSQILQIKPATQRDQRFVGIKNQMKINNLTALKLRRFLQRKVLQHATSTGQVEKYWIVPDSDKLAIKVTLQVADREIQDSQVLDDIIRKDQGPVVYSVN